MNAIYEATVKLLGSDLPVRALQQSLDEGLSRLGKDAATAGLRDMEKVLKGNIYRQLQVNLPAVQAKNKIQQVLDSISKFDTGSTGVHGDEDRLIERQSAALAGLEDALKRFNLYFEWPEVQKFRAQLGVIKEQHAVKRAVPDLVKDAQTQQAALERKLQDLLVRQSRDVVELQESLAKVKATGGPRVKRLESLVSQVADAQASGTLAPAEVERARKLASELRKLVESSVVAPPVEPPAASAPTVGDDALIVDDTPAAANPDATNEFLLDVEFADDDTAFDLDFAELSAEQSEKVREIDLREEARALESLEIEYRAVIENAVDLAVALAEMQRRNSEERVLLGAELERWRSTLEDRRLALLTQQRARLAEIPAMLQRYADAGMEVGEAILTHSVAEGMTAAGVLANDDIATLEDLIRTFERQFEDRARAQAEEHARLERQLARQEAIVAELKTVAVAVQPLGQQAVGGFYERLKTLIVETQARQIRDDLTRTLGEEAQTLQAELERRTAAARLAAEQRAAQERTNLEAAERAEAERRAAAAAEAERLAQQRNKESGVLRGMRVALAALPDVPELAHRVEGLEQRLAEAAGVLESGRLLGQILEGLQAALNELGRAYTLAFADKLADLEARAQGQGAKDVLAAVEQAKNQLAEYVYPDLATLEGKLRAHRETRLNAQRRELAELEMAAREYGHLPESATLSTMIAAARAGHESGQFVELAAAWGQLDDLRAASEATVSKYRVRADEISREFEKYKSMGGETVRALARLVEVMGTELSVNELSSDARNRLERTIQEAETTLAAVRDEYEAANAVAQALKDTSQIDDLLGIFDLGPATASPVPAAPTPAPAPVSAAPAASARLPADLRNWLENLALERGVTHAVIVSESGALEAGAVERVGELSRLLGEVERYNLELAGELKRQLPRLYTLEFEGAALIGVALRAQHNTRFLVVLIDDMASYSRIFAQVHRDCDQLRAWTSSGAAAA